MGTTTLPNVRASSDIRLKVRLKDGGVALDWPGMTDIRAYIYSDAQKAMAGRCTISVDGEDDTLLICDYASTKPQYLGVNRIVLQCKYDGRTKTYDKAAMNIVARTADVTDVEVTIDDPEIDVEIDVEDVSSSILDGVLAACIKATEEARDVVDVHRGPEGMSAYEVAVQEGFHGSEDEWLASLKGDKGNQGDQGIRGPAGVESVVVTVDNTDGTPSAESSVEDGVLSISFSHIKGQKGDQGNSGYSGAAGELEIVNNDTDGGATAGWSAERGKAIREDLTQLSRDVLGAVIVYNDDTGIELSTLTHKKDDFQVRIKSTDIGKTWDEAYFANATGYMNYFIPVTGAKSVTYSKYTSSSDYGSLFLDANDVIISGHAGTANDDQPYTMDVPSNAVTFVWSLKPSNYASPICSVTYQKMQIGPDSLVNASVTTQKIADGAVTADKIAEGAIQGAISDTPEVYVGYNLLNPETSARGYIVKSTGKFTSLSSGTTYATDFIPASTKGLYAYCGDSYGTTGGCAIYNSSKTFLRANSSTKDYEYQQGDGYVRFTYKTDNNYQVICEKPASTISGTFTPTYHEQVIVPFDGDQVFAPANIPEAMPAISQSGQEGMGISVESLSGAGETLDQVRVVMTDWPYYIKSSVVVSASALVEAAGEIRLGVNRGNENIGYFLRITGTNLSFCKYTGSDTYTTLASHAHGLTIADTVSLVFSMEATKMSGKMFTSDGAYTADYNSDGYIESYGRPFIEAVDDAALSSITLRAVSPRLRKPVWFVGDSYLSFYSQRWPVQMMETFGVDNFLVDGLAGGSSSDMLPELRRLLNLGTPKILVWVLGMNDQSWSWRDVEKQVEMLCRERGITLVLQTIPEPESGTTKAGIRQQVRESGYRYIDAFAAVCDSEGEWYTGFCADGVHPTTLGAKALAARILADLPEIMQ